MTKYQVNDSCTEIDDSLQITYLQQNIDIIRNLDSNDLFYIEKDLEFYDKVSLVFLLYGGSDLMAKHGCQKLILLYNSQSSPSPLLEEWSQKIPNWRDILIEALWTIKAMHVLRKLGLHLKDLKIRFLQYAEVNLYIHPVLKGLYSLSENLHPDEAKQLIDFVSNEQLTSIQEFTDEKYLEVFLLGWLSESVIQAGDWSITPDERNVFCNVELILQYLKLNKSKLVEELSRIVIRFNFTSKNVTSIEKKKNVTDDDGNDVKGNKSPERNCIEKNISSNNSKNGSDCEYHLESNSARYVLIVNQIEFYRDPDPNKKANLPKKDLEKRDGTDADKMALIRTFSAVGYEPVVKNNLTDIEILQEIKEIVSKSAKSDSLIVCILSHGSEGVIYGSNSMPVKIKDIQDIIVSEQLLNKPKILILQSCQGEETQIAVPVESDFTNSNKLAHDGSSHISVPMRSDFCIAKSTISGYSSIRHINKGSWFIQTLCRTIDEEKDRHHFLDIMTNVLRKVTELRGSNLECMVPIVEVTFTKHFYFPSKIDKQRKSR